MTWQDLNRLFINNSRVTDFVKGRAELHWMGVKLKKPEKVFKPFPEISEKEWPAILLNMIINKEEHKGTLFVKKDKLYMWDGEKIVEMMVTEEVCPS